MFLFSQQVDVRCPSGFVRDSATRGCVKPTDFANKNCKEYCGADGGVFDVNIGGCKCNKYTTLKELCNSTCLANSPKVEINRATDGAMQIVVTSGGVKTTEKIYSELGLPDYDRTSRECRLVDMKADGIYGYHPTDPSQALAFSRPSSTRKRRAVTTSAAEIRSPLICVTIGQAVLFRINLNPVNRTLSNYPQYKKNHLFNTNPNFDYGNFRQLHTLMQTTNQTITTFVYAFTEPGVHVFYDNAVAARETIVMVPQIGSACPAQLTMDAPLPEKLTIAKVTKQAVSMFGYI